MTSIKSPYFEHPSTDTYRKNKSQLHKKEGSNIPDASVARQLKIQRMATSPEIKHILKNQESFSQAVDCISFADETQSVTSK